MEQTEYISKINKLAAMHEPFLFIINYQTDKGFVYPLNQINPSEILYNINGNTNTKPNAQKCITLNHFNKYPISAKFYKKAFNIVKENLEKGNSYLTNLTCETPIDTNLTLQEIFYQSKAKYRLWYRDEFVVFSPEIFIKINQGKIKSYPMKGTIDAQIENAEQIILNNTKEAAEHATIVDLIRNDLSMVATNVKVDKYRYIDVLETNEGNLLQVSSEISGDLPQNFNENLGNIIYKLLPAGSICGAPKQKTLDIINQAEGYNRGFYTGIFGIYDGKSLDTGVMIRFIENQNGKYVFKSGGGITNNSNFEDEYKEMIRKVYLPI